MRTITDIHLCCAICLKTRDQFFNQVDSIPDRLDSDHDALADTVASVATPAEVVLVNDALSVCKEMALLKGADQPVQFVFR